ncbi:MAG: hypothetical protein ACFWTK_01025 [Clostridium sp.]|jgi:hypothetical protein
MKKKYFINISVLFALLSYSYYYFFYFIQNFSNKTGFPLHPNGVKLIESIVLIGIVTSFYVIYDINESIYLTFSYVLHIFVFLPMGVFYWMSNSSRAYFYMQFISFLILNLFYYVFVHKKHKSFEYVSSKINFLKIKNSKFYTIFNSSKLFNIIFLGIIGLFIIADILAYKLYGNSIYYLFHMKEVYSIRLAARAKVPAKMSYIISWSALVIIPSCIAWCVKHKKYFFIAVPVIIQVLLFTIGGNKSHLFGLALTIFIFILFKNKFMYFFTTFLNFVIATSLIINNKFIMAIVIRRTFFVPASTSNAYYDFFSINPKIKLANSIFRVFFEDPYKLDPSFIISRYIYRLPDMSSNANYIANAYANFGLLGILVFSIILSLVFLFIEYFSLNKKYKEYIILISFSAVFVLTNSALLTTLSNHGLAFSIIMSYVFIKAVNNKENLKKPNI